MRKKQNGLSLEYHSWPSWRPQTAGRLKWLLQVIRYLRNATLLVDNLSMELPTREEIVPQVRILQIIVFALVMGCVTFAPIAFFVSGNIERAEGEDVFPVVSAMAVAFGAVALIAQLIIVPLLRRQSRQRLAQQTEPHDGTAAQLLGSLQSSTIVGAAISEAACFFNLIAYLLEAQPYTLAVAAVLVLTIAMRFPTVNGVLDWLEREKRLVNEEREFGRGR